MDYRTAGVDVLRAERIVERVKRMMGEAGQRIGHFAGLAPLPVPGRKWFLVTSIDGVGTKTRVAAALNRWEGLGRDLVHHSLNDLACTGAEPVSFVDYIAMARLDEEVGERILSGLVDACRGWNLPLVGGETAEMPGVYQPGEVDLVGAINGVVDEENLLDGRSATEGDILLGFASEGLHTNGFTLARRVLDDAGVNYGSYLDELGETVGEALLRVHYCYLNEIKALKSAGPVKGLAHITGGGLEGNTVRIVPKGLRPEFFWGKWDQPPVFGLIKRLGKVPEEDMRRTFNLGIGLVAIASPETAQAVQGSFPSELKAPQVVGILRRT